MAPDLVLASASATRQGLLKAAGIPFRAVQPDVDESIIKIRMAGQDPAHIARELAGAKALDVSRRCPGCVVLGADQTLNLDGRLFDKPASVDEARDHLTILQGKTHRLETAAALAQEGHIIWRCQRHATLTMRALTDEFLETYTRDNSTDVTTSVGGYKIEGRGLQLFSAVEGSHFVILGLPLLELCAELRGRGILPE